ncbi:MAG: hypothetical protein PHY62_07060 [Gallionella sp.]|nr:hypothetical protein [Gallionella sp.]
MRNELNLPLMAQHRLQAIRWIAGIGLWLMATVACAQFFDRNEDPIRIAPKGTISLEYPNEWDTNTQIALSNDGSRLIDATERARHIRVWDWKNKKIVQRLLLNEKAPEENDGKDHVGMVLQSSLGQELALSPDGRMVAGCASTEKGSIRIWSIDEAGVIDIPTFLRRIPGQGQEMIFTFSCSSISYSEDSQHLAILFNYGESYNSKSDYEQLVAIGKTLDIKTGKYKNGMSYEELKRQNFYPANISGIALFETRTWKLEQFFYRTGYQQFFNSRPLFDAESKTVSAVLFDRPPIKVNDFAWNRQWVGNRIVRWDIASGAQLEERDMPQLASLPENGVWWTPLPSGREVWWRTGHGSIQTDKEAEQCRQNPPPPPEFVSDNKSNCAYEWSLAILNLESGKIRYLAPFKQDTLLTKGTQDFSWASITPDGAHIVLFHKTENTQNPLRASSSIEVRSMETWQLEGRYSDNIRFEEQTVFSSDSRYFAFPIIKSRDWVKSAVIFELPKSK